MHYIRHGHPMSFSNMWFFRIIVFLLIVIIIITIYKIVKKPKNNQDSLALSILKERYAKGEIDEEEFQNKKKHLI